jgi:hypothetical protein
MRARVLFIGAAAAAAGAAATYAFAVRPWWRSWGVDPVDATLDFAGDDLVPDATVVETRGIEIDAPPDAVWPWLVQMGYNRAGWYSYDAIDMKGASVSEIVPELQHLAVGDLVPNSPDTAFVVRSLDAGRSLVLYADEKTVEEQVAAARARKEAGEAVEEAPANLKAAGKVMPSMPGFAASWAFVLRPLDDGRRTRLTERFRVRMPAPDGPAATVLGGAFGFGVFAMTRKQMLGIRDRAEAAHIAAGITAEFSGRWGEKVAEVGEATVEKVTEAVAKAADTAAEIAGGAPPPVKKVARKAAKAADTAVETAGDAKPAARKTARKAAPAADEVEPTV